MAELRREGDEVVVVLSAIEKGEAVHGDVRLPASAIVSTEVLEDAIHAVHGIKAPGTCWPGRFAIGSFYFGGDGKTFAVVHHDTPRGVRVRLQGTHFDQLIIGCPDPEAVVARLGGPG